MSAWPEAVWVSKKLKAVINEVFDINDAIDSIEEDLNGTEGIDTAIDNLANQIDKEMVVIATNTGSSAEPYPYGVGTDVGKHSVFLILTTTSRS